MLHSVEIFSLSAVSVLQNTSNRGGRSVWLSKEVASSSSVSCHQRKRFMRYSVQRGQIFVDVTGLQHVHLIRMSKTKFRLHFRVPSGWVCWLAPNSELLGCDYAFVDFFKVFFLRDR